MADEKDEKEKKEKRYYWLKLKEGFFRDKKIKKLRKIAGGDTYTIIYLKMQLLSLKNHGTLLFEGVEDNFAEEVALEIDEEVDNVKVTMAFLFNNGMLEEIDGERFLLPEAVNNTGSESTSAERVRKHRAKKKVEKLPKPSNSNVEEVPKIEEMLHCNTDETKCNEHIEKREKKEEKRENIEELTDKHTREKTEYTKDNIEDLTDRQRERVEFLKELFVGWSVTDYQIYYLSFLISDRLPYDMLDNEMQRDMKVYDAMQKVTMQAKADNVKNIYRWSLKVIPNMEF